jgi:hypothetical protein
LSFHKYNTELGDVLRLRRVQTSLLNPTVKFFLVFYLTCKVNPLASRLPTKEKSTAGDHKVARTAQY